jgi:hypothetical protein
VAVDFAARHDTFEGQRALQELHDIAARGGAVCNAGEAKMASRHEASTLQGIHDLAVQHGAHCSTTASARFSGGKAEFDQRAELDRLLAMTPLGRSVVADRRKAEAENA